MPPQRGVTPERLYSARIKRLNVAPIKRYCRNLSAFLLLESSRVAGTGRVLSVLNG
jgi:hypothetical protein